MCAYVIYTRTSIYWVWMNVYTRRCEQRVFFTKNQQDTVSQIRLLPRDVLPWVTHISKLIMALILRGSLAVLLLLAAYGVNANSLFREKRAADSLLSSCYAKHPDLQQILTAASLSSYLSKYKHLFSKFCCRKYDGKAWDY